MKKANRVAVFCPMPGNLASSATSRAKDGMEFNMGFSKNPTI
jgi:hypothetical protein